MRQPFGGFEPFTPPIERKLLIVVFIGIIFFSSLLLIKSQKLARL